MLPMVAAKLPVPLPATSPVKVIVWSPVFVPDTEASSGTVSVFEVVPPAIVKPTACAASVRPFTVEGVIDPRLIVSAGVVPPLDEPETPFADAIDIAVTYDPLGCLPFNCVCMALVTPFT